MASKRKRSDGGGADPPANPDPHSDGGGADPPADPSADPDPPAANPLPADEAAGRMVDIWSCDTISVAVSFPVEHAWLFLRNYSLYLDRSQAEVLRRFGDGWEDSFSQADRTLPPKSFCTEEVLKYIREYVRDYVHPDGAYKEAGPLTRWNFHGDAQRANGGTTGLAAKCFELLEAADFLDIDIWSEAITERNDSGQTLPTPLDPALMV